MNRRRMSGHRAASGGAPPIEPATSVRQPWAVYEEGDGISATGNGPTLDTIYSWDTPAIVGDALLGGAEVYDLQPGVTTNGDFSIGFLREINANSLTTGEGAVVFSTRILGESRHVQVALNNFVAQGTLQFNLIDRTDFSTVASVDLESVSVGIHHFALSVSAGSVSFFLDGVQVGPAVPITLDASAGSPLLTIINGEESYDGAYAAQFVYANVAYTAPEWLYIVNGGAGRAYSTWSITP